MANSHWRRAWFIVYQDDRPKGYDNDLTMSAWHLRGKWRQSHGNDAPYQVLSTDASDANGLSIHLIGSDSLKEATLADKLIIVAHGAFNHVSGDGPVTLARKLKGWGLKEIGLVSFHVCNIGTGEYLNGFARAAEAQGIGIGFLKGYCGTSATQNNGQEIIKRTEKRLLILKQTKILQGSDRYTIIKGNKCNEVPIQVSDRYGAL